jgi:hypothetical protein
MVVIGVAGEFWADNELDFDDGNLQLISIILTRDAGSSAKIAAAAAEDAQKKADGVGKKAAKLDQQLRETGGLFARFKADVGPRVILLDEAEPELVKTLSRFPKQTVWIFGSDDDVTAGSGSDEVRAVGLKMNKILDEESHWNVGWHPQGGGHVSFLPRFCWIDGVQVFISSKAQKSTSDAANALSAALSAVLPRTEKEPHHVDPKLTDLNDPRLCISVRAATRDTVVSLVIGERSQP